MADKLTRIAIINPDKCKPKKCKRECQKACPLNKQDKQCIVATETSKIAYIAEPMCIGCGICVKRCPFHALRIINLPKSLENDVTYRYGPNTFKLHRLPTPRPGQVLGLVGKNGIGKSTALKILAAKLAPNFGNYEKPPTWKEILKEFRGNELQGYFMRVLEDKLVAQIKPQYVDSVPDLVKGNVKEILEGVNENKDDKLLDSILKKLDLSLLLDRDVSQLSGGELQRFITATICLRKCDIYMFDEPSSYLDVKQRLKCSQTIRGLLKHDNYVIAVEHDLSILDYLSDFVCCLWGNPGAYGVVTAPFSVREGINVFLAGFIPTENLRFRDFELSFRVTQDKEEEKKDGEKSTYYNYPAMGVKLGDFHLLVKEGKFKNSEIVVLLGENGTGKSTFINLLAGKLKPEGETKCPELFVSYKPQKIAPKFEGSVEELLEKRLPKIWNHVQFQSDVFKPLNIEHLLKHKVKTLSGGELQKIAITLALGTPAEIYLIDEPSAYLDSEERLVVAKIMKRYLMNNKKCGFIVEHDFIMASYLADRVVVFEGEPGKECVANAPEGVICGMNKFLKSLEITFRRDPDNYRPRINKMDSVKDKEQKSSGNYFCLEE
jgi:ATP-binding cassette subfamily E protein 1